MFTGLECTQDLLLHFQSPAAPCHRHSCIITVHVLRLRFVIVVPCITQISRHTKSPGVCCGRCKLTRERGTGDWALTWILKHHNRSNSAILMHCVKETLLLQIFWLLLKTLEPASWPKTVAIGQKCSWALVKIWGLRTTPHRIGRCV